MTNSKTIQAIKEEFKNQDFVVDGWVEDELDTVWSFIESHLKSMKQQGVEEGLKKALRANFRYPLFANPHIVGDISYRDWLRKQIKLLSQKQ